jgi:uncharacterized integral membrane protein
MQKAKHILWIILLILVVIVILQNTASVETKILFVTITMPRAVLLFITGVLGYAIGAITTLSLCKKSD